MPPDRPDSTVHLNALVCGRISHERTKCGYGFSLSPSSLRAVVGAAEHLAFPDVRSAVLRPGRDVIGVWRVELLVLHTLREGKRFILAHVFPSFGHQPF